MFGLPALTSEFCGMPHVRFTGRGTPVQSSVVPRIDPAISISWARTSRSSSSPCLSKSHCALSAWCCAKSGSLFGSMPSRALNCTIWITCNAWPFQYRCQERCEASRAAMDNWLRDEIARTSTIPPTTNPTPRACHVPCHHVPARATAPDRNRQVMPTAISARPASQVIHVVGLITCGTRGSSA
jgi:hypothetical protein